MPPWFPPTTLRIKSRTSLRKGSWKIVDKIFVVDDSSTDGTTAVLSEIKDLRLTVVRHQTNQGVGGSDSHGFSACTGLGGGVDRKDRRR